MPEENVYVYLRIGVPKRNGLHVIVTNEDHQIYNKADLTDRVLVMKFGGEFVPPDGLVLVGSTVAEGKKQDDGRFEAESLYQVVLAKVMPMSWYEQFLKEQRINEFTVYDTKTVNGDFP